MQIKIAFFSLCLVIVVLGISTFKAVSQYIAPSLITPLPINSYAQIPSPTPTSTPTPSPLPTATIIPPTPTITPTPAPIVAPGYLNDLFIRFSNEYSVNNELLKRIAKCESGFGTGASSHGYAGLFQFSEPIWIQTRTLMGMGTNPDLRFSGEESIRTAAFMLSQNHGGIWPNCAN